MAGERFGRWLDSDFVIGAVGGSAIDGTRAGREPFQGECGGLDRTNQHRIVRSST
jgi:hypothetical protein